MSKNFTPALKRDLKEQGITYEGAADMVGITTRQFIRQVHGSTKTGLMPVYMVSELRKRGLISEGTVEYYIEEVMEKIRQKKEKARRNRAMQKLLRK